MDDDPNSKLKSALTDALDSPLSDEKKVLDTIVKAIVNRSVDKNLIEQAVKRTVNNYENQLRVFMIAVATNHLPRIQKLLSALDLIDEEMNTPRIVRQMDVKDLLKSYALMQATLTQSLDYVKKVTDMRMELEQAQSAITSTLSSEEAEEINKLAGIPKLDATQRNRVRTLIEGMIVSVKESDEGEGPPSSGKNGEHK